MLSWVERRAKKRKDGRVVVTTSVVFDANVLNNLGQYVSRDDGLRSAIICEALRYALAVPGWIEATVKQLGGDLRDAPAVRSRAAPMSGGDIPETRRSPSSRPPRSRGAVSSSSKPTPRK